MGDSSAGSFIGIDRSPAMISSAAANANSSSSSSNSIIYKQLDANDGMAFSAHQFTHITCLFYTLYFFEDKIRFIQNCVSWLQPRGFFIVHAVDPKSFRGFRSPRAVEIAMMEDQVDENDDDDDDNDDDDDVNGHVEINRYCRVDSDGFTFRIESETTSSTKTMVWREIFQDKSTKYIRQQEQRLFLDESSSSIQRIVSIAEDMMGCQLIATLDLSPVIGKNNGEKLLIFQKVN
jgi:SAM-dependent methyltransferase